VSLHAAIEPRKYARVARVASRKRHARATFPHRAQPFGQDGAVAVRGRGVRLLAESGRRLRSRGNPAAGISSRPDAASPPQADDSGDGGRREADERRGARAGP
jgi:hypothetical protein